MGSLRLTREGRHHSLYELTRLPPVRQDTAFSNRSGLPVGFCRRQLGRAVPEWLPRRVKYLTRQAGGTMSAVRLNPGDQLRAFLVVEAHGGHASSRRASKRPQRREGAKTPTPIVTTAAA
jgi:hypothetical protein